MLSLVAHRVQKFLVKTVMTHSLKRQTGSYVRGWKVEMEAVRAPYKGHAQEGKSIDSHPFLFQVLCLSLCHALCHLSLQFIPRDTNAIPVNTNKNIFIVINDSFKDYHVLCISGSCNQMFLQRSNILCEVCERDSLGIATVWFPVSVG